MFSSDIMIALQVQAVQAWNTTVLARPLYRSVRRSMRTCCSGTLKNDLKIHSISLCLRCASTRFPGTTSLRRAAWLYPESVNTWFNAKTIRAFGMPDLINSWNNRTAGSRFSSAGLVGCMTNVAR
jgi:hypothetical protein